MVFWSTAEGPSWVCCVRKMSMTISIRRGKGRSLDAYSTAHWLKSIINKTTKWRGLLTSSLLCCKSIPNQLLYLICKLCWAPLCIYVKVCLYLFHISLWIDESKILTSRRCRVFRNRSSLPFPISSSLKPSPTLFHHLPHLWLQCCRSESVCKRGMYVHTNTDCAAISPYANTERLLPALPILINKGISIELLLNLMETDGCCCLQV